MDLWVAVTRVRYTGGLGGNDIYSNQGLTLSQDYQVLGIVKKIYEDRSNDLCYLLIDDNGKAVQKAIKGFVVVETKEKGAI